jgi:hypothetical protein
VTPRRVLTGMPSGGATVVLKGLSETDSIAVAGTAELKSMASGG